MPSTFETLSDEILMTIFQYSGDIYTVFRIFLGLNQRLNCILLADKHSHQLSQMHSPIDEQQFREYFQSLVTSHIEEQSKLTVFNSIREQLSDVEIIDRDNQLRNIFFDLPNNVITIKTIKHIQSLILINSARLQCDNYELNQFNFAKALNRFLLCHLNNVDSVKRPLIQPITQLLKTLIISNTRILMNRDRIEIEDSASVWYFLFYSIYQLQYYYYTPPDISINMTCYNAIIDLLLFAIQCQLQTNENENWIRESLFDILKMIPSAELSNKNTLYIQSIQWEILKLIVDQFVLITKRIPWQEDEDNIFRSILHNLIKINRLDVILLLYHRLEQVQSYFNKLNNIHQNVNILTGSLIGRQLFDIFINEKPLKSWLTNKDLIFLLLQKKERKSLEKLFRLSPCLINEVDENGNNPLLYICLKVRGCRYRIIKFLLMIGCDLERRNFNNENFIDAIQLKRNESLFKDLLDNQIIKIDDKSGQLQVILFFENVKFNIIN